MYKGNISKLLSGSKKCMYFIVFVVGLFLFISNSSCVKAKTKTWGGSVSIDDGIEFYYEAYDDYSLDITNIYLDDSVSVLTIPEIIEINDEQYKVVDIYCDLDKSWSGVKKVEIPKTIEHIGECNGINATFADMDNLEEIVVDSDNAYYKSKNGVLYNADFTWLLKWPCKSKAELEIPDTVTKIADYAFQNCGCVKGDIILSDNITDIGTYAFDGCTAINRLQILGNDVYVDNYAFPFALVYNMPYDPYGNSDDENWGGKFIINKGTHTDSCFQSCSNSQYILYNFDLYNNSTTLAKYNGLQTDVIIPEGVEDIAAGAFSNCKKITRVTIPSTLRYFGTTGYFGMNGNSATGPVFSGCSELVYIDVSSDNNYFFSDQGILFHRDSSETELVCFPPGRSGYQTIDPTFASFYGITIKSNAFCTCNKLDFIEFGSSNSYYNNCIFEAGAFSNNSNLTLIAHDENDSVYNYATTYGVPHIIKSKSNMYDPPKYNYSYLEDGTIKLTGISTIVNGTSCTVNIPNYINGNEVSSIEKGTSDFWTIYRNNTGGSSGYNNAVDLTINIPASIRNISSDVFGKVNSGYSYANYRINKITVSETNNYYLSEDRGLYNKEKTRLIYIYPDYSSESGYYEKIDFEIPEGVVGAQEGALNNLYLLGLSFPASFTDEINVSELCESNINNISVDNDNPKYLAENNILFTKDKKKLLFYSRNKNQTTYSVPNTVSEIGDYAFYNLSTSNNLTVSLPTSVNKIGKYAFATANTYGLARVSSIKGGEEVSEIGDYAFCKNSAISSLNFEKLKIIGAHSFESCSKIKSFQFSDELISVDDNAFSNCSTLDSITIPSGVTSWGKDVFKNSSLKSVTFDDGFTVIPEGMFYSCKNLEEINLPNSLTEIGENSFRNCTGIKELILPNSLEVIKKYALNGCSGITTIIIPNGLSEIETYAFASCERLNVAVLPISIENIGVGNFKSCSTSFNMFVEADSKALEYAVDNNIKYQIISSNIEDNTDYEYELLSDGTIKMVSYKGVNTEIIVPPVFGGKIVTEIGEECFKGQSEITSITLPDTICLVGKEAFANCSSLTQITLNAGISSYGDNLLEGCTKLEAIDIPKNVKIVPVGMLKNCTSLSSVTFPSTITEISSYAFMGCTNLNTLTLPSNLNYIRSYAFSECTSITDISLPANVREVDGYAFYKSTSIKNVYLNYGYTKINNNAFLDCSGIEKLEYKTEWSLNVSYGFNPYAFRGCTNLSLLVIPDKAYNYSTSEIVADGALYSSNSKETLLWVPPATEGVFTVPDTVKTIKSAAFIDCKKLTKIIIPESVTSIAVDAFDGCNSDLIIEFSGDNASYEYDNGVLYNCGKTKIIRVLFDIVGRFVIPDTVETLPNNVFENQKNLTEVFIPDSVSTIPQNAFENCTSLETVSIEIGTTDIGANAFLGCSSLKEISLPDNLKSIGNYAFSGCTTLSNITIPESVTSIGSYAFSGCSKLKELVIPDGVKTIQTSLCENCIGLQTVVLGNGVQYIYSKAFSGCANLSDIDVPKTVEDIRDDSFQNCGEKLVMHVDDIYSYAYAYAKKHNIKYELPKVKIEKIELSDEEAVMKIGDTYALVAEVSPEESNEGVVWESSNEDVATVSRNGTVTAIAVGDAVITVSSESDESIYAQCQVTVKDNKPVVISIASIEFADTNININEGSSTVLEPEILPEDTTEKVKWSSNDTTVATVSSKGVLRALSKGTADITVSNPDGTIKSVCTVTVVGSENVPITALEFSETKVELNDGDSTVLEPKVTPEDATEDLVWTSSNAEIVSVSNKGKVTAKNVGEAEIKVSNFDGTIKAVCTVVVNKAGLIKIQSLSFAKEQENITEGGSIVSDLIRVPANATEDVVWSSDNEDIVTVDRNGTLHGKSKGLAVVTASTDDGRIKATCNVNVVAYVKPITKLSLEDHELTFSYSDMKNMTRVLSIESLPNNATEKAIWSSDRPDVVNVDRNGTITVVGVGTAIIKVESPSDSNVSDSCTINILTDEQKKDINAKSVVVSNIKSMIYDGNPKKQDKMKLFDNESNTSLTEETDYSVSYSPNVDAGTVVITITGKGIYSGTRKEEFSIMPYDVSGNDPIVIETQRYYNALNFPVRSVTIQVNKVRTTVTENVDYVVDYGDSKLPGTGTAQLIFMGNYTGGMYYTRTTAVYCPTIKSLKKKGKKIVMQLSNPQYVSSGYEIYRATKSKGKYKKVKTIKNSKVTKYTDSKVKKGKTYYYKVRAYVKVNGTTYYSDYSGVSKIKR